MVGEPGESFSRIFRHLFVGEEFGITDRISVKIVAVGFQRGIFHQFFQYFRIGAETLVRLEEGESGSQQDEPEYKSQQCTHILSFYQSVKAVSYEGYGVCISE